MQLKSLEYIQHEGEPEEWSTDGLTFGNINLIVGKNATGKTRTLNVLKNVAGVIAGDRELYGSGSSILIFNKNGMDTTYELNIKKQKVIKENLTIGSEIVLDRGSGGQGKIRFDKEKGKMLEFQAPVNQLACLSRMDSIQHPFFESLNNWGKSLRHYYFGTALGQDRVSIISEKKKGKKIDPKDTNKVVGMLKKGMADYGNTFLSNIIDDMDKVKYRLDDIRPSIIEDAVIEGPNVSGDIEWITVKESDLAGRTTQGEMSQGMFRTLSLLIQLNFCSCSSLPSCILIDDIGEGLDYERSTSLIDLLIDKAKGSNIQLIMSTNDRFVMNKVPLKYWSVIERFKSKAKFYNYRNAKDLFDDFDFTGLSNFDFFASRFHEGKKSEK